MKRAGAASEQAIHRLGSAHGDTEESSAPAGVDRGDGAPLGVGQQNREAVRGANADPDAGAAGNERVALSDAARPSVRAHRNGGMDLVERRQRVGRRVGVAAAETVFQPLKGVQRGRAPDPGFGSVEQL